MKLLPALGLIYLPLAVIEKAHKKYVGGCNNHERCALLPRLLIPLEKLQINRLKRLFKVRITQKGQMDLP